MNGEETETGLEQAFARKALEVRLELLDKIGEAVEHTDAGQPAALSNLTKCLKEINEVIREGTPATGSGSIFDGLADTVPYPSDHKKTNP